MADFDLNFLRNQLAAASEENDSLRERLNSGGGGGTSGGMDPWQQTVETRLGQLHTDNGALGSKVDRHLVFLLSAFAAAFLVLAGGGWTAYTRLDDKIDHVGVRIDQLGEKIDHLATAVAALPHP